jgi:hypothetical protein
MNPLEHIYEWYNKVDDPMKADFTFLTAMFHPDPSMHHQFEESELIKSFNAYLDSSTLQKNEIMQRALYLKGVIEFALDGRDTEEGWEQSRKLNEAVSNKWEEEKGEKSGVYENFMKNYPERKEKWIEWANEWKALTKSRLSYRSLAEWYFIESNKTA